MQVLARSSSYSSELKGSSAMDPDMEKSIGSGDEDGGEKKVCFECKTTRTPLWRSGPAGPKSLCNACGIRFRKRRRAAVAIEKRATTPPPLPTGSPPSASTTESTTTTTTTSDTARSSSRAGVGKVRVVYPCKRGMMFRRWVVLKKQRCQRRRRMKVGEEEQAAFVLMALSCGAVFA